MGQLPNPQQLQGLTQVQEVSNILGDKAVDLAARGRTKASVQEDQPAKEKPQHYLASPELPTIPHRLAQRIWDSEFEEMEEFLPSNRTIQALESLEGANSLPGSVPQQQSRRALDISTWIRCFTLYIVVMSQKRPDLVPPMTAHLHTVMKLEQSMCGMSWFQYDWRARREMCAAGASTWGRRDPWGYRM